MKRIALLTFTAAIIVFGCRKSINIIVSQPPDSPPVMRLEPMKAPLADRYVEITALEVDRVFDGRKPPLEPVWVIVTKDEKPVRVTEITYGVVPPEFKEIRPAQALVPGAEYNIRAGKAGNTGGARFTKQ